MLRIANRFKAKIFRIVQAISGNHIKENNGYCIREQKRFHVNTLFSFLTFESLLSNFFLETGFSAEPESKNEKNFNKNNKGKELRQRIILDIPCEE